MVWVHGSPLTKGTVGRQIPELAEQNRAVVRKTYTLFDDALSTRDQLAGDAFTMADVMALCTIDFATQPNQLPPDPALAHLARWRLAARERLCPAARARDFLPRPRRRDTLDSALGEPRPAEGLGSARSAGTALASQAPQRTHCRSLLPSTPAAETRSPTWP